jgi:hypothetical protein
MCGAGDPRRRSAARSIANKKRAESPGHVTAAAQAHFSFDGNPGIHSPFAEHSINVSSRRSLVSSFLALMTQKTVTRRYHGGCSLKYFQARFFDSNFF